MILGYLGAGALLAALVMGGFSALLSFWSGVRQSTTFIQVGRRAFYAAAAMTFLSAVVLEVALLTHDFSLAYVVEHTDLSTPTALVAAAFYGGQEGSLLYWTVVLGILGSASLLASASLGGRVPRQGADCLQVPLSRGPFPIVSARFVRAAHRAGLPVHVWTVDEESTMNHLLDLGVDGIMTDRPRLLRNVFAARGLPLAHDEPVE